MNSYRFMRRYLNIRLEMNYLMRNLKKKRREVIDGVEEGDQKIIKK